MPHVVIWEAEHCALAMQVKLRNFNTKKEKESG
jgi:hypothetical protein